MINALQWGSGFNLNKISSISRMIEKRDTTKHNPNENQFMSFKALETQVMAMAELDKASPVGNRLNTIA